MKVPPPRRRWWSMKRWWAVSLAGALALFAAWQFAAYHLEGGIAVADRPGETPLSQRFPVSFRPLAERAPEFLWPTRYLYRRALRKFPDLSHCIENGDIERFRWLSMRNEYQAELCLFHMAERLGTYKAMEGWFTRQGFATETYAPRDGAEAMLKKGCPTYRVLGGRGKSQAKLSPFS